MNDLSLDSDGVEADRDEVDEESLKCAFQCEYHQESSVSVGLERVCVLHMTRVGDKVCTVLDTGCVSVHTLESLGKVHTMKGHTGAVTGVASSVTCNSLVYTSSSDQTVRVWDLREGRTVRTLRDTSDPGKASGPPSKAGRPLSCVSVSYNGNNVVAGTDQVGVDSYLLFWDTRQPSKLSGGYWESHSDDITSVEFHPTMEHTLASGSTDGQVNVFDISQSDEDEALVTSHNTEDSVAGLKWYNRSKHGQQQLAVVTHTESLQLWNTESEGPHTVLTRADLCHGIRRTAAEHVYVGGVHARTGEDGLVVLAGSSYAPSPCLRLALVKNKKAKPLGDLVTAGASTVRCSLLLEDGGLLTGGEDGVIRLWKEGNLAVEGKADGGKIVNKASNRDKPY